MSRFHQSVLAAVAATALLAGGPAGAQAPAEAKPTIVLVHGAFADASSWYPVIQILQADGYTVVAAANALRGPANDAASVSSLVGSIAGPVVLVGHSYGGVVISAAANGHDNVEGLVFVAAFAPDAGETAGGLNSLNPGSTLGSALAAPVPLGDGTVDLYIDQAKFHDNFAADLPAEATALAAAAQRPVRDAAFTEVVGEPAWKSVPSWFIYGEADLAIDPKTLAWMADRAGSRHTVAVPGASHVVMVSHPAEVAALIEEAATPAEGQ